MTSAQRRKSLRKREAATIKCVFGEPNFRKILTQLTDSCKNMVDTTYSLTAHFKGVTYDWLMGFLDPQD